MNQIKKTIVNLQKARRLRELLLENEADMGEQGAFQFSCEALGVEPDDGYVLLAMLGENKASDEMNLIPGGF